MLCQSLIELLSVDFAGIGCRGHLAFKPAPGIFLFLGVFAIARHTISALAVAGPLP